MECTRCRCYSARERLEHDTPSVSALAPKITVHSRCGGGKVGWWCSGVNGGYVVDERWFCRDCGVAEWDGGAMVVLLW